MLRKVKRFKFLYAGGSGDFIVFNLAQSLHANLLSDDELKLFFKTHHVVRKTAILRWRHYANARRLSQIQTGQALTTDEGVVEPMQLLVQTWLQQWEALLPSIQTFDQRIETLC